MGNGFRQLGKGKTFLLTTMAIAIAAAGYAVPGKARPRTNHERVPGELIVKLRNTDVGAQSLYSRLSHLGVQSVRPFKTDTALNVVKLKDDSAVDKAIKALKSEATVAYAEPNFIYRTLNGIPNDPDFVKTWGLKNEGQADDAGQLGVSGSDINVVPLWDAGHRGSRKVVVAVIDTGIEWTHPDLQANIYTNSGEIDGNAIDDDGNGFIDDTHGWNFAADTNESQDDHSHGTHCAGTIGGHGDNAIGVAGVNWEVSLLPIKFLTAQGGGTLEDAVEAINYATLMGVDIMSNSWGGGGFSQAMEDAIKASRDQGILFVAAAGNDASDNDGSPMYPASYTIENVLAVAATDNQDKIASFSNWGSRTVHVAAPGVKVYSTILDGKYKAYSGTSMATPHVAGISALMLSIDPTLSFSDIKERLITTSDPVRGLKRKVVARGRVNAFNAVHNIVTPIVQPDPTKWITTEQVIESEHPYLDKTELTFPIEVPGAKYVRVHIEKLDTEANYDKVTIETEAGEVIDTISGTVVDYTSEYVEGQKLIIRFKSDYAVPGWGFKIDRIEHQ